MARLKAKSIDRNRLSKNYPFIRVPQRMTFIGDNDVIIELVTLKFENESSKVAKFDSPFEDTDFRVVVSPRDTENSDSANVSLYINSTQTTTSQVTIESSAPFTGVADVIAIRIKES